MAIVTQYFPDFNDAELDWLLWLPLSARNEGSEALLNLALLTCHR